MKKLILILVSHLVLASNTHCQQLHYINYIKRYNNSGIIIETKYNVTILSLISDSTYIWQTQAYKSKKEYKHDLITEFTQIQGSYQIKGDSLIIDDSSSSCSFLFLFYKKWLFFIGKYPVENKMDINIRERKKSSMKRLNHARLSRI